ncbi:MAG TPA: nucleotide sugar dehydrogenase [Candidatus Deferrimicrobium sp.]|nr:nucleotide sugar dehydrogenase [Candidatus Deferrimicrobium sp.]
MTRRLPILVVGAGYVGLATAVFMAEQGFAVEVVEKNRSLLDSLRCGHLHFREPVLEKKLKRLLKQGRLSLCSPAKALYETPQFIFIAIDSAVPATARMRLTTFERLAEWIGDRKGVAAPTVVLKSTNVVGFAERFHGMLRQASGGKPIRLIVNPEFLREGHAYSDTAHPWRIIIGAARPADAMSLRKLYRATYPHSVPVIVTDWASAELIKLASNVYLSHRLAFIHEVADFARGKGLDISAIKRGIGLDPRIGIDYFQPGLGFGGSCLPKDCQMIGSAAFGEKFEFKTAKTALAINDRTLDILVARMRRELGKLQGTRIAILGAAFKAEGDDVRGSQAVKLALKLRKHGVTIALYEPFLKTAGRHLDRDLALEADVNTALRGAAAVIIGTPHRQFRTLSAEFAAGLMQRKVACDYFGIVNKREWIKKGFRFI